MPTANSDRPDVLTDELDLIERLRAENADLRARLDKSQLLLNGLAEVSSDIFWQTDENHRFVYLSPGSRNVFGGDMSAQLGKDRSEVAHSNTDTEDWPALGRSKASAPFQAFYLSSEARQRFSSYGRYLRTSRFRQMR